jgi:hypothetical protein
MSYPNDGVVRPGSSDALTARTIDATIHPPLVRAQETMVGLVPRVAQAAAPFTSPLFLGAVALTLLFTWVAIRLRYRPSALVLGALLIMTLSSFHPMQTPDPPRLADARRPRTTIGAGRVANHNRAYVPTPPTVADYPTPGVDPVEVYISPDVVEHLPEWSRDAMQSAERMMRENERVREIMRELRYRVREEARRQRRRQMADRGRDRVRTFDLIESP